MTNKINLIIGIFLIFSLNCNNVIASDKIDWQLIAKTYHNFTKSPDKVNIEKLEEVLLHVYELENKLSRSLVGKSKEEKSEAIQIFRNHNDYHFFRDVFNSKENYRSLDKHIVQDGNYDVIDVFFKVDIVLDGAFAEDHNIILGEAILPHTRKFLLALKENINYVPSLDSLLGNLGDKFVDKLTEQEIEIQKRFNAIENIKDKNLLDIRKICLEELISQLRNIKRIRNELKGTDTLN